MFFFERWLTTTVTFQHRQVATSSPSSSKEAIITEDSWILPFPEAKTAHPGKKCERNTISRITDFLFFWWESRFFDKLWNRRIFWDHKRWIFRHPPGSNQQGEVGPTLRGRCRCYSSVYTSRWVGRGEGVTFFLWVIQTLLDLDVQN